MERGLVWLFIKVVAALRWQLFCDWALSIDLAVARLASVVCFGDCVSLRISHCISAVNILIRVRLFFLSSML